MATLVLSPSAFGRPAKPSPSEGSSAPGGSLLSDSRGAVMFMGVFMALFLIGALWFLVGIGDAIVYRQAAQEASDSGVFSSAAIHAKGMNIIAFLNCLMLAIVFIYLILAIIVDVILFVTGLAIAGIVTWVAVPELVAAAKQVDNVAKIYKQGMAIALPIAAAVQTGVAILGPWGGTIAAGTVSKKYGFFTIAAGPSNIPGTDASIVKFLGQGSKDSSILPKDSGALAAFDGATKKLGLPVKTKKMNFLCEVAIAWVFEKVFKLLSFLPIPSSLMNKARNFISGIASSTITATHCREKNSGQGMDGKDLYDKKPPQTGGFLSKALKAILGKAMDAIGSLAGFVFTVYASEDWWGDSKGGPKALYSSDVVNGSEWTQIWGWTPDSYDDKQDGKVRVATYKSGKFNGSTQGAGLLGSGAFVYTAQSEFYFDCKGFNKWKSPDCNGDDLYDYTMYAMRWRARIVRYRGLSLSTLGNLFGGFLGEFLTTNKMLNWFKDKLGLKQLVGKNMPSWMPDVFKKLFVNRGKNNSEDLFSKAVKGVVGKAKGALKPASQGSQALH